MRFVLKALLGLALLLGYRPALLAQSSGAEHVQLLHTRQAYLDYWQQLGQEGTGGLERFAMTVQRVVDTRAAGPESGARQVLDDLVDLFVTQDYLTEKRLLMSTPPVLGDDALHEDDAGLAGFADRFRDGEGRFRHFALNAAASFSSPDLLVSFAARLRGRDFASDSPDSRADIATNRVGQEFGRLLRSRPLEELGDGVTVKRWLLERFGEE